MPLGDERGRIAGCKRIEPSSNLAAGPAKDGESILVMGPSSSSAATHSSEMRRRRRLQQPDIAQGQAFEGFFIMR